MKRKGFFITFEGPEGSGKSTQLRLLAEFLCQNRISYVTTREPGGSKLNTYLRHWLLDQSDYVLSHEAELFLFLADRTQHVLEVLKPSLAAGKLVISDRYVDSTLAYQGGGRGFPMALLKKMNETAVGGLKPGLTVLFDLPVLLGLRRAEASKGHKDRMEREPLAFHEKVRKSFLDIAKKEPGRFLILDSRKSQEEVFKDLLQGLKKRLPHPWKDKFSEANLA
jgi:dTMP kinase